MTSRHFCSSAADLCRNCVRRLPVILLSRRVSLWVTTAAHRPCQCLMPSFRGLLHWLGCNWNAGSLTGFLRKRLFCAGDLGCRRPGIAWTRTSLGPTTVLDVADDGGWSIRFCTRSRKRSMLMRCAGVRWKQAVPWSAASRLKIEPSSLRGLLTHRQTAFGEAARFVLGTDGLVQNLRTANSTSLGYLAFIGTLAQPPERRCSFGYRPTYVARHRRGCWWSSCCVVGMDSDRTHMCGGSLVGGDPPALRWY